MDLNLSFLEHDARRAAERCLEQESAKRQHVVIALSGSHAYGFPSPDSDLDLKAVHIEPTDRLLGLSSPRTGFDRLEVIDGVEVDYTSNELGGFLAGLLAGNGNYFERVLGPLICLKSEVFDELAQLARGALSCRVYRHYAGFAHSQLEAFTEAEQPTVKKLLYVLRTALTGAHVLATGELVTDLRLTSAAHGFAGIDELIAVKQQGERTALADRDRDHWRAAVARAFELLERSRDRAVLPQEPETRAAIEAWLVALRRRS